MNEGLATPEKSIDVTVLQGEITALKTQVGALTQQLDWFKRQLFGRKSERRLIDPNPDQPLLNGFEAESSLEATVEKETITYQRRKGKHRGDDCVTDQGLRFDGSVPMETIQLSIAEELAKGFEPVSEKITYRLAQRPGSYVVLKYIQPVVKRKSDGCLITIPAPDGLWAGSLVDVSVVAGIIVDKFAYHLPLYRQHQRLSLNGITVARSSLTHWVQKASALLKPIYLALLRHILLSKTLAMDETPIKAGRSGKGDDVVHAQCWAHTRRQFERALSDEPRGANEGLDLIGQLYAIEKTIRDEEMDPTATLAARTGRALPVVDAFFAWLDEQRHRMDWLPSQPFAKALAYAAEREGALRVYLSDPAVAIDTNHLERALRPIPMGRKNWMFCWTEVGAEHVGILQSLICTCRLHGINPYTYLVDVLQRIAIHPDSEVEQLTPRVWKTMFANQPLRSDLAVVTATRDQLPDVPV